MSVDTLFVYGSLTQGMVHYNKIANHIQDQRNAITRGTVYRLEVGYPVFSPEGSSAIHGVLLTLANSDVLHSILDQFHGYSPLSPEQSLFIKTQIEVLPEGDFTPLMTWAYSINTLKLPRGAQVINDGDWKRSMKEKEPLTQILTTTQRSYIQRLGRSTGRDIVPINLDLYRELMNKGLIVDKGRRLALTPLGQEVFRFLE